jgi:hypothetical protein
MALRRLVLASFLLVSSLAPAATALPVKAVVRHAGTHEVAPVVGVDPVSGPPIVFVDLNGGRPSAGDLSTGAQVVVVGGESDSRHLSGGPQVVGGASSACSFNSGVSPAGLGADTAPGKSAAAIGSVDGDAISADAAGGADGNVTSATGPSAGGQESEASPGGASGGGDAAGAPRTPATEETDAGAGEGGDSGENGSTGAKGDEASDAVTGPAAEPAAGAPDAGPTDSPASAGDAAAPPSLEPTVERNGASNSTKWIVAGSLLGAVCLGALIVLVATRRRRLAESGGGVRGGPIETENLGIATDSAREGAFDGESLAAAESARSSADVHSFGDVVSEAPSETFVATGLPVVGKGGVGGEASNGKAHASREALDASPPRSLPELDEDDDCRGI